MKIRIDAGLKDYRFCFMLAALILTVPLRWIGAVLFAAAVHEMGHVLACRCMNVGMYSLCIGMGGAKIHMEPVGKAKEFFCAAAGPAASFLLLLFSDYLPRAALCGAIQGAFNLFPLYPLDGGRMLQCVLQSFLTKERADYTEKMVVVCAFAALFAASITAALCTDFGVCAFIPIVIYLTKRITGKIPCKEGKV